MDTALDLEKEYTIEDIYKLPEGQRAELIDGHMYIMAPPRRIHQEISYWLGLEIGNYIRSRNGGLRYTLLHLLCFCTKTIKLMWNRTYP